MDEQPLGHASRDGRLHQGCVTAAASGRGRPGSQPAKSRRPHHLGVNIDKSERLSDWTQDELTPSQLQYAAGDVEYLLPLIHVLTKQLDNAGLQMTYQQCMEYLPTRVRYEVNGWADVFSY